MTWVLLAAVLSVTCSWWAWRAPRDIARRGDGAAEELAALLATAPADERRVVVVNDLLDELDHALRRDAGLPKQLAWIALTAGLAVALLSRLREGSWAALAGCVLVAVLGVGACAAAQRATGRVAIRVRARVDGDVESLLGELYRAEIVLPRRREMRWKRARR